MSEAVQLLRRGEIALVTVDSPPVNALGQAVRAGLIKAFQQAEADPQVRAVVLVCAGRTFMAGADIREFGKPAQAPSLPDVIEAIERSSKPSVAVIHGTALGGGLEVALACHYRIARRDAQVGLPEVKLGLLPGAGGTQRLPRLAGVEKALDMIVSGAPIRAADALDNTIVDELFDGDLIAAGLAFAQRLLADGKGPRRTGERNERVQESGLAELIAHKRGEVQKRLPGQFSPQRCIDAVEAATQLPMHEGLVRERELFLQCMESPQRAALIHAFFAEREAARVEGLAADVQAREIRRAAVIGGGTMGVGIVLCFANAGIPVQVLEVSEDALQRGLDRARSLYAASVARGSLSAEEMERRMGLISGVLDYAALGDADVVVEAVFESLEVKRHVFQQLDAACKLGAILASNTSSLDLDEIAAFTQRPQDVVGLHFFSPANVMRLLEVVRGKATSDTVLATSMQLGKRLKKVSVMVGVCDGFVGNRMIFQYGRQAEFLLEEGATPAQVDRALRAFGMAMGPLAVRDLSGLDISHAIRSRQRPNLKPGQTLPAVLDHLIAAGMLGQKTGTGFYQYGEGGRAAQDNPALPAMLEQAAAERGIIRAPVSDEEIVERCIYALINEAANILDEGIAQRASDVDVIFLNGYGFPTWRGGPLFHADSIGLVHVLERIREFHRRLGAWWQPAPLLERLVAEGRRFADL
ncbi:3-hydroxyacyl-CoA dehydrogenase NAD-binding domain-containing protein [Pseudomonas sp. SCB32]|uniref:3-hydroxyacyl-CoA dehydrogenase NAD-binding domain-containing protein n=1 Tax=Pseudomonas sp. SCB32 TaxID=2653853 RepID=UPI00126575D4|nr:3-hydroxyacyl-CoA dehydrogenase NAD-binding domain-containing protein [Pseudomonas sp. SCB32]